MGYKLLGFAVWQGGKWYVRRRYGHLPKRVATVVLVVTLVTAARTAYRKAA